MDLLADLDARGLLHDTTDRPALAARLESGPVTVYYGCDPTADSLHTGNLIGLVVLRRFAEAGHHPIALAGGATGMVGDPGGRSEERNLLDVETLAANVAAIKEQIGRVMGPVADWELVDNLDWTADLRLLDFLRDVGKHATVNQMVARESVKARMESEHGISYTEFSYMLLQANDYRLLHDERGCELQIGGSDQWGNMLQGVDLIRRTSGAAVHALSWPLITAADGTKLGKTTGARVWLGAHRTSPADFYQHWLHTDDRQVAEFLKKFTLLSIPEIDEIVREHGSAPQEWAAQHRLAREVTALVHGAVAATAAAPQPDEWTDSLDPAAFRAREGHLPTYYLDELAIAHGLELRVLLADAGMARSRTDATKLIEAGAVKVNGEPVRDPNYLVRTDEFMERRWLLVQKGKRHRHVIVLGAPSCRTRRIPVGSPFAPERGTGNGPPSEAR